MNEQQVVIVFALGVLLGVCVGLAWALHIMEQRAKRYKERALQLTVTPELVAQINATLATQWLDSHGYCWMPKGKEFRWPREVKR